MTYSTGVCCANQPKIHFGILIFEDRKVIALYNLPTLSKNAMCWAMLFFLFGFSKRFLNCPQKFIDLCKKRLQSQSCWAFVWCVLSELEGWIYIQADYLNISTIIQILLGLIETRRFSSGFSLGFSYFFPRYSNSVVVSDNLGQITNSVQFGCM
jgi:hypothetical protein